MTRGAARCAGEAGQRLRWGAPSSLPHSRPLGLALLGLALAACQAPGDREAPGLEAEFGVFYGGQVQELDDIPLSLDSARQRQGFRLELTPPPEQALEVRWELGKAGQGRPVPDSEGRRARPREVQRGRAHFRPGEPVFEQVLPFAPGDPLGLWNIRVLLAERVVIERPFVVYDPIERSRQREAAASRQDAGW